MLSRDGDKAALVSLWVGIDGEGSVRSPLTWHRVGLDLQRSLPAQSWILYGRNELKCKIVGGLISIAVLVGGFLLLCTP